MERSHPIAEQALLPAVLGGEAALAVEAPRRATAVILGALAPLFLDGSRRLYLADGANGFDPYRFSAEARRRGLRDDVLDRVFVSRAFTIHQLAAVVADLLPALPRSDPPPVIALLGADHLFREETLRAAERARVLGEVIRGLSALRRDGTRMLVTHEPLPRREAWWKPLHTFGDIRCVASADGDGEWKLQFRRRRHDGPDTTDVQYLAPG